MNDQVKVDIDVQPGGLMFGPLTIKDGEGKPLLILEAGAFIKGDVPNRDTPMGVSIKKVV